MQVRFSTVIGAKESSECARDPRGFAVKLRTEEGNWDLVGNNLQVFFIREAMKFPDLIHALKPDPITNRQEPNRYFDFFSFSPESMHTLTWLFSTSGIPKNFMTMRGSGVNTYKLVNQEGKAVLCKFHWIPQRPEENLTMEEASEIQKMEVGHASRATYEAIENGKFPQWELNVQIMDDSEHPELDFDPLDDTKIWAPELFPYLPVGMMTLNRNVQDFHCENEQAAFGAGVIVDGIDFSDDKMLTGRTFSYSDTQRYRIGSNYLRLPVNCPLTPPNTNMNGGAMAYLRDAHGSNPHINYEPSSPGGVSEAPKGGPMDHPHYNSEKLRAAIWKENNYGQARKHWEEMSERDKNELIYNMVTLLGCCETPVRQVLPPGRYRLSTLSPRLLYSSPPSNPSSLPTALIPPPFLPPSSSIFLHLLV